MAKVVLVQLQYFGHMGHGSAGQFLLTLEQTIESKHCFNGYFPGKPRLAGSPVLSLH